MHKPLIIEKQGRADDLPLISRVKPDQMLPAFLPQVCKIIPPEVVIFLRLIPPHRLLVYADKILHALPAIRKNLHAVFLCLAHHVPVFGIHVLKNRLLIFKIHIHGSFKASRLKPLKKRGLSLHKRVEAEKLRDDMLPAVFLCKLR